MRPRATRVSENPHERDIQNAAIQSCGHRAPTSPHTCGDAKLYPQSRHRAKVATPKHVGSTIAAYRGVPPRGAEVELRWGQWCTSSLSTRATYQAAMVQPVLETGAAFLGWKRHHLAKVPMLDIVVVSVNLRLGGRLRVYDLTRRQP
jgi:hypothetical protein